MARTVTFITDGCDPGVHACASEQVPGAGWVTIETGNGDTITIHYDSPETGQLLVQLLDLAADELARALGTETRYVPAAEALPAADEQGEGVPRG